MPALTDLPTESLLAQVGGLPHDDARRESLVDEVMRRHAWVVRTTAARYSGRGEDFDVLVQEASLGLMEAIDRYNPERGAFLPFARITALGLVRRHFRDRRRWIQIPRRLQEVQGEIRKIRDEITQTLGHEPTDDDLATRLGVAKADVAAAGAATFRPMSLDAPVTTEEESATLADRLGVDDTRLEEVADLEAVRGVTAGVPVRQRQMLLLYFFGNLTQREIAGYFGMSQMHVSRLLRDACVRLRDGVLEGRDPPPTHEAA